MPETVRFRSETIHWWSLLMAAAERLNRVHRWDARAHGPRGSAQGMEQHPTDTLVLCLAGIARIEDGHDRLDLGVGDAVVIRPGAWHHHAPLRHGTVVYRQGIISGRSDFFLESADLLMIASWPAEPSHRLLAAMGEADEEDHRRHRLAELLTQLRGEVAEPLPSQGDAVVAMEYSLWSSLHRSDAAERIVAASGRSRAQAYRLFRERWGAGIASVVRSARLELARALLQAGLPVAEAAERCGIRNPSVFARAYHRHWGTAPSRDVGR